jgi:hypothetical protein
MPKMPKPNKTTNDMEITTIGVKYSRKINLGDYESAEAEIYLGANIDPDERVSDCISALMAQAKASVKESLTDVVKASEYQQKKIEATRRYMGRLIEQHQE